MKSTELREKSDAELAELAKSLRGELFQARIANFTNQLDDTSSVPKKRRVLARVLTEQRRRELAVLTAGVQQALAQESA
jgi:ribosomal protein L29